MKIALLFHKRKREDKKVLNFFLAICLNMFFEIIFVLIPKIMKMHLLLNLKIHFMG